MKAKLQRLGKAIMQPVAILPVAAILVGIANLLVKALGDGNIVSVFLSTAGTAVLGNLGILFAIGIAYGLSKDSNGAASLSALVGFLIVTTMLKPEGIEMFRGTAPVVEEGFGAIGNGNVFIGIIIGILAANAYNKFYQVKLPDALAFFSGRRLVPIITAGLSLIVTIVLYFLWPFIYKGLVIFGSSIAKLGAVGAGIYGFGNRLLIPTGLHHALNSVFWFDLIGINDIGNFWAGQAATFPGVTTGMYQAGFFPIMMFGLPGAALAMYKTADPDKKTVAKSLLISAAFASFFTGVTEPLEFSFMFLAPGLYLLHAVLTGISVFIAAAMKWIAGFSFSAGLVDYILSFAMPTANKPYMLLVQGVVFFIIYYFLFKFLIVKFNLMTPGRGDSMAMPTVSEADDNKATVKNDDAKKAEIIIEGLGGVENIKTFDYCSTRLRVEDLDPEKINEAKIKQAQVIGITRPGPTNIQIIIGTSVQFVFDAMQRIIG